MLNRKQFRQAVSAISMLALLGGVMSYAQAPVSGSDADQIAGLIARLCDHSKSPSDALDPSLNAAERDKNLRRLSAPRFELSLVPTDGIPKFAGDSVSVPVRVHFDAKDGNSLDVSATATFVKRNGTWYFSNFDFLSWPAFLILVLVVGVLVGIGYAVTVIVLMLKLLKHGALGLNGIRMFLPIFWPSLFRQTR